MNPRGIPKGISRLLEPHPMRTRRSASLHGKNRWRATVPRGRDPKPPPRRRTRRSASLQNGTSPKWTRRSASLHGKIGGGPRSLAAAGNGGPCSAMGVGRDAVVAGPKADATERVPPDWDPPNTDATERVPPWENRWRATVPCGRGQWRAMLCHGRWVRERSGQGLKTDATERVPPDWDPPNTDATERVPPWEKPVEGHGPLRPQAMEGHALPWALGGMPWWQVPRRTRRSASLQNGGPCSVMAAG